MRICRAPAGRKQTLQPALLFFRSVLAFLMLEGCSGSSQDGLLKVVEVFDGDTVAVLTDHGREKVRLIGIDAPEMDEEPWGRRAQQHLDRLLDASSRRVRLESDVERRDQHGRLLSYLWTADGTFLNEEMVRGGFAVLYTIPPNVRHVDRLRKAQREAKENSMGVWGPGGLTERPSEYRRRHPR